MSHHEDDYGGRIGRAVFQRIFNFSNDAVAITDGDGNIIDVNQAFLSLYGYERDEAIGKNPRILKSTHTTAERYAAMWRDILDPEKGYWRGEIINRKKDGAEVPVLLSINAIRDDSGAVVNFLGIAFDMTRQKELENVNRLYFNYVIHDLRGPLTSIMSNAELLIMQNAAQLSQKSRKKLDVILSSALKLSSMTNDILDFARLQSGSLTLKKEPVEFSAIVAEAATPFEYSGKRLYVNGVEFDGEPAAGRLEVAADRDKLQRVVYNLLSNAFKHAASEVRVVYESDGSSLRFVVADDGTGVRGEDAMRIFDAFYQTTGGVVVGGSGLGLTIVKSFVEAHGGKVWREEREGEGAAFAFMMPKG